MYLTHLRSLFMIREKIKAQITHQTINKMSKSYEEAINCINTLQSNNSYIQNATNQGTLPHSEIFSTTIAQMQKYLLRTGITYDQLDKLSVIHVAGTKGKGSTCAFCESIIRNYGYKTGFYSSPHLVAIRERIKINGKPLSEKAFAENVFKIYNQLMETRDDEFDMPGYFRFLTVLAFNIFIVEKVDVAILEVGIGGEYDCTNIVRNTPIVGITSLGLDHTSMLGSSLEEIAWQKSGIMKKNSRVFTVHQPETAMKIIQERSKERDISSLNIVPDYKTYKWEKDSPKLGIDGTVQKKNASLAIQLAQNWIKYCGVKKGTLNGHQINDNLISERTKIGLELCKWPGRYQILKTTSHTFYLDGAHTTDSLEICAEWFENSTKNIEKKALIFNATGTRNSEELLQKLSIIKLKNVIFVPNVASSKILADQINLTVTDDQQIQRCERHKNIWMNLKENKNYNQNVRVFPFVEDAIKSLYNNNEYHVLITGSLHLIGAALSILDPELKTF